MLSIFMSTLFLFAFGIDPRMSESSYIRHPLSIGSF